MLEQDIILEEGLQEGPAVIVVLPGYPGVVLPPSDVCDRQPDGTVHLRLSLRFPNANIRFEDDCLKANLGFKGTRHEIVVPFGAIPLAVLCNRMMVAWPINPPEEKPATQSEPTPEPVKRERPPWLRVIEGGPANTEEG